MHKFYDNYYQGGRYGMRKPPHSEKVLGLVNSLLDKEGYVLEIGAGRGKIENFCPEYIGVDISQTALKQHPVKHHVTCANAEQLPIKTASCKMVYTIACLEHVIHPEIAFEEIDRVLISGGLLFLAVAWHVRPWASEGLSVRPYKDLILNQKISKALIYLRDSKPWRGTGAIFKRFFRRFFWQVHQHQTILRYKKLRPNYDVFWCSDSDAAASIDSHEGVLFFESRHYEILSHPTLLSRFLADSHPIVARKC